MRCSICGSTKYIEVEGIGIALGMGGYDYDFCRECLKKPAKDLFKWIAKENGFKYPLKKSAK